MRYTIEEFYADLLLTGTWIEQCNGDLSQLLTLQAKEFLRKYGVLDGVDFSMRFNRVMSFAAAHDAQLRKLGVVGEHGMVTPEFLEFLLDGFEDADPGLDLVLRRNATQLLSKAGQHRDSNDNGEISLPKVMKRWNERKQS